MVAALQPRAAGWWGQELSFGLWCRAGRRPPDEAALSAYAASVAVPIRCTGGYLAFCADAITQSLPRAVGSANLARRFHDWWRQRFRPQ